MPCPSFDFLLFQVKFHKLLDESHGPEFIFLYLFQLNCFPPTAPNRFGFCKVESLKRGNAVGSCLLCVLACICFCCVRHWAEQNNVKD